MLIEIFKNTSFTICWSRGWCIFTAFSSLYIVLVLMVLDINQCWQIVLGRNWSWLLGRVRVQCPLLCFKNLQQRWIVQENAETTTTIPESFSEQFHVCLCVLWEGRGLWNHLFLVQTRALNSMAGWKLHLHSRSSEVTYPKIPVIPVCWWLHYWLLPTQLSSSCIQQHCSNAGTFPGALFAQEIPLPTNPSSSESAGTVGQERRQKNKLGIHCKA